MIVTILHDVTTGLQFLHSAEPPICHGDVNSKNVLIDSGNRGKVADFGLNHEGHDFAWRGTVRYMAPELFDSEPITKMSDVYSFGILLCECFERQTPYRCHPPLPSPLPLVPSHPRPSVWVVRPHPHLEGSTICPHPHPHLEGSAISPLQSGTTCTRVPCRTISAPFQYI